MAALEQRPTAYEILGVHSSAPSELMNACYWAMARDLQEKRATKPETDVALHQLTIAYESVSDPVRRAGYNLSIGNAEEPLTMRALPRKRFFLLRVFRKEDHTLDWSVGPHEVLGLHPRAPQASVSIAYRLMRETYMRLTPGSRRRETLLKLLDESYEILGDPEKRAQLPGVGSAAERELPAPVRDDPPVNGLPEVLHPDVAEAKVAPPVTAPALEESPRPPQPRVPDGTEAAGPGPEDASARDDPSVNGLPEVLQPDVAEAKVAPPVAAPAPEESPRHPKTQRRVPDGTEAAGDAPEDGVGARQAAVAIVAFAAVAAGAVARGVLWVVVAVAALAVAAVLFVARSLRSGWLATRKRLGSSQEEPRETKASRSREASSQTATSDEIFLGRLASTVGKLKTERRPSSDETTRR